MKKIYSWLLMLFVVGALPTGLVATENKLKQIKVNILGSEEILKKQNELEKANKELTEKETIRNEKKTKRQNEIAARNLRLENRQRWYSRFLTASRTLGTAGLQVVGFAAMSIMANMSPDSPNTDALRTELRAIARDAKLPWADELRVKLFPGNIENAAAGYDIFHPNSPFVMIGMGLWNKLTPDEQCMIFLHECGHIDGGHVLEMQWFLAKRGIPLAVLGVQSLPYAYWASKWCVNKTGEGISAATQWATQKTKNFAWYLTPEFVKNRFTKGEENAEPVKKSTWWTPAFVTSFIDGARTLRDDLGKEFGRDHLVKSYRSFTKNNERIAPVIFGTEKPRTFVEAGITTLGSFAWGMAAYYISAQLFRKSALALGKSHEWYADRFALDHARGRGDVLAFKNAFAKMLAGYMSLLSQRHAYELLGKSQVEREQFLRHKVELMNKNDVHPTPWQRMELCDKYLERYPAPAPESGSAA